MYCVLIVEVCIMKDIKNYSITEASRLGISAVIRTATEDGYSAISKNGELVAMVMPLTLIGIKRYNERMLSDMRKMEAPSELQEIMAIYKKMLDKLPAEA